MYGICFGIGFIILRLWLELELKLESELGFDKVEQESIIDWVMV